MWFAVYLYRRGLISAESLAKALVEHAGSMPSLGQLDQRRGLLSTGEAYQVLDDQANQSRPFAELAIERGLLRRAEAAELLLEQQESALSIEESLIRMQAISAEQIRLERTAAYREAVHIETSLLPTQN